MNHFAFALHFAAHAEKAGVEQGAALVLGDAVPHDDIGVAGFILERYEDHAVGGAGVLAAHDESRRARELAVA